MRHSKPRALERRELRRWRRRYTLGITTVVPPSVLEQKLATMSGDQLRRLRHHTHDWKHVRTTDGGVQCRYASRVTRWRRPEDACQRCGRPIAGAVAGGLMARVTATRAGRWRKIVEVDTIETSD